MIDTSVWIEYFKEKESKRGDEVKRLLEENRIVITGSIMAELLQGAREEKDLEKLKEAIISLPFLKEETSIWEEVGRLSFD
ncbi:MAG: PIN domain-containing protein [bacterium]